MNDDMKLSPEGAKLIQSFEGLFLHAYYDPVHVLTIGWGHTNVDPPYFNYGDVWTEEQCREVFFNDMVVYENAVKRNVKVELNQHQFDALCSFTYNCGEGNLRKSNILACVNGKDFEGAARSFAAWNHAGGRVLPGLTRRRAAEALLFQEQEPAYAPQPDEPMAQQVDDPKPSIVSTLKNSKIAQSGAAISTVSLGTVAESASQMSQTQDAIKHMGYWEWLLHLAHQPSLWLGMAVVILGGYIIYWRWKDHA